MVEIRKTIGVKTPVFVAAVLLLIAAGAVSQEAGHGRSIESIVEEIVRAQGVSSIDAVDPDAVSPSLLEELGDSVMDEMIDDEQQHEWIDEMMGGEGSAQLAAMHRWIGYNYIESDGELLDENWGPGMMGFGVMGPGMMSSRGWNAGWGHGSMMRWWSPWSWIIAIVVISLVVLVIVLLVRRRGSGSRDPMDILKRRYANGEISREEFERIRDDLRKPS